MSGEIDEAALVEALNQAAGVANHAERPHFTAKDAKSAKARAARG